jgi:hypothetical protein
MIPDPIMQALAALGAGTLVLGLSHLYTILIEPLKGRRRAPEGRTDEVRIARDD